MIIICPKCQVEVDTDADETLWEPPHDPSTSVASIRCPSCRVSTDFVDWKHQTSTKAAVRETDK